MPNPGVRAPQLGDGAQARQPKRCDECGTADKGACWRPGPGGPGRLCSKCGVRWYRRMRLERAAAAAASADDDASTVDDDASADARPEPPIRAIVIPPKRRSRHVLRSIAFENGAWMYTVERESDGRIAKLKASALEPPKFAELHEQARALHERSLGGVPPYLRLTDWKGKCERKRKRASDLESAREADAEKARAEVADLESAANGKDAELRERAEALAAAEKALKALRETRAEDARERAKRDASAEDRAAELATDLAAAREENRRVAALNAVVEREIKDWSDQRRAAAAGLTAKVKAAIDAIGSIAEIEAAVLGEIDALDRFARSAVDAIAPPDPSFELPSAGLGWGGSPLSDAEAAQAVADFDLVAACDAAITRDPAFAAALNDDDDARPATPPVAVVFP